VAKAEVVIFANAYAARDLLSSEAMAPHRASTLTLTLSDLQAVHGTASLGHMPSTPDLLKDAVPHNGHGCFIPGIPAPYNLRWWLAGSSFEPDEAPSAESLRTHQLAPLKDQSAGNLQRLRGLLPEVAAALAPQFHGDAALHWSGTRCVTHDRLPLAGPVDKEGRNGLWMHVGMGARGLTFSALGAELIAARICQEPWPVETSLARSIDSQRLRKRRVPREPESDSH
jgi:tRNA 5-methylaminomethyl-2-thiouridine biosynthesis bifunctional protein